MAIDFFASCCKTTSSQAKFGLRDDEFFPLMDTCTPPTDNKRAYIDENEEIEWIAEVENTAQQEVDFYALDNCVPFIREDGSLASRCDGLLSYAKNLIFVELKSREKGRWVKRGREQLTATISKFDENYNRKNYSNIEAYVSNNLKPDFHSGQQGAINQFFEDTDLILNVQKEINL